LGDALDRQGRDRARPFRDGDRKEGGDPAHFREEDADNPTLRNRALRLVPRRRYEQKNDDPRRGILRRPQLLKGTHMSQELTGEGLYAVSRYRPQSDKVMRMHAQTVMIENGFVRVPESTPSLAQYLHEMTAFSQRPARRPGRFDGENTRLLQRGRPQLQSAVLRTLLATRGSCRGPAQPAL
jgi:hypothetical protein